MPLIVIFLPPLFKDDFNHKSPFFHPSFYLSNFFFQLYLFLLISFIENQYSVLTFTLGQFTDLRVRASFLLLI